MSWESSTPLQYGRPINSNPTVHKLYAAKTFFSVEEFVLLLVGIDPTSFDGTELSNKVKKEKVSGVINLIWEEIEEPPIDDNGFPIGMPRLYGEEMKHDGFSAATFFEFCQKKKIEVPFDWRPKEQEKGYTIGQAVFNIVQSLSPNGVSQEVWEVKKFTDVSENLFAQFAGDIRFDKANFLAFMGGYSAKNPDNLFNERQLLFPREAFFEVWSADRRGMDVPRWFADLEEARNEKATGRDTHNAVTPADVIPKPRDVSPTVAVPVAPSVDAVQLISGVTVANIRALFDKDNPRYRPPLAAAVWLWCSFESKGVPVGMTPKQEAKRRLGAEIPPAISTDWTDKADEEILKMVNWQKKPKKE